MKEKTTTVIFAENPLLIQEILRDMSRQFMKDKEITNVIHVENLSLNQDL